VQNLRDFQVESRDHHDTLSKLESAENLTVR
jgi:hypothetical protein